MHITFDKATGHLHFLFLFLFIFNYFKGKLQFNPLVRMKNFTLPQNMKISIYPPNVVISPLVFGVGKLLNVIHLDPKKNFVFRSDSYQLGLTKKKKRKSKK